MFRVYGAWKEEERPLVLRRTPEGLKFWFEVPELLKEHIEARELAGDFTQGIVHDVQ